MQHERFSQASLNGRFSQASLNGRFSQASLNGLYCNVSCNLSLYWHVLVLRCVLHHVLSLTASSSSAICCRESSATCVHKQQAAPWSAATGTPTATTSTPWLRPRAGTPLQAVTSGATAHQLLSNQRQLFLPLAIFTTGPAMPTCAASAACAVSSRILSS
jgi:hypothetical protein